MLPALVTTFVQFVRFPAPPFAISILFHFYPLLLFLLRRSFLPALFLSAKFTRRFSYLSVSPLFRRLFASTFGSPLSSSSFSSVSSPMRGGAAMKGQKRGGGVESFVRRRTSVTRKNICVIIYYLERKIEIFRRSGTALPGHTNDNNSRPGELYV